MPVFALAFAALFVGFEQLMQLNFGTAGVIGCLLLAVGFEAKNVTCSCVGAAVLTMLLV